jgi:hypothetical protein
MAETTAMPNRPEFTQPLYGQRITSDRIEHVQSRLAIGVEPHDGKLVKLYESYWPTS